MNVNFDNDELKLLNALLGSKISEVEKLKNCFQGNKIEEFIEKDINTYKSIQKKLK